MRGMYGSAGKPSSRRRGSSGRCRGQQQGRAAALLDFAPADAALPESKKLQTELFAKELLDDPDLVLELRHELGKEDVERCRVLANLPPQDCDELMQLTLQRRRELKRRWRQRVRETRAESRYRGGRMR